MIAKSAGLVVYKENPFLILLCQMGGPYFAKTPMWTIPKGLIEENEESSKAAIREFTEETGITPPSDILFYTQIRLSKGFCDVWITQATKELDITGIIPTNSNTCEIMWPPKSGKYITIPETINMGYFPIDEAMSLVPKSQVELLFKLKLTHPQTQQVYQ